MSLPESSSSEQPRGVLVRRPKTTIYTVLLLISVAALAFASLIMIIEWAQYGFQWKPPANLRSAVSVAPIEFKVQIMAQGDLVPPTLRVVAPKPKMTIYFALLIIALGAMLGACLMMYLEIRRFQRDKASASIDRPVQTLVADARPFDGVFLA